MTAQSTVLHVPSLAAAVTGDLAYNQVHMMTAETVAPLRHLLPAQAAGALTDASHSIAVTGMFNAHHARARLSCHQEPIRAVQCQLSVPRTTVR
jgi:hypothetical protein